MRHWSIHYRSAEIYGTPGELVIDERPCWAVAVSTLCGRVDTIVFHHRLCEPPEWCWHVPFGRATRDDDGELVCSLGSMLRQAFDWLLCLEDRTARATMSVDLMDGWLRANGQPSDFEEALGLS